eukprot:scaffold281238_cov23-Tisochrysis_lutea.AAC.1
MPTFTSCTPALSIKALVLCMDLCVLLCGWLVKSAHACLDCPFRSNRAHAWCSFKPSQAAGFLHVLLRFAEALLRNEDIGLEPYVHQLLPALLTCL